MPNPANKTEVFKVLCESRALLWKEGLIAEDHGGDHWIGHAVDPLQIWALEHGLVEEIGQDAVQRIMSEAFR